MCPASKITWNFPTGIIADVTSTNADSVTLFKSLRITKSFESNPLFLFKSNSFCLTFYAWLKSSRHKLFLAEDYVFIGSIKNEKLFALKSYFSFILIC